MAVLQCRRLARAACSRQAVFLLVLILPLSAVSKVRADPPRIVLQHEAGKHSVVEVRQLSDSQLEVLAHRDWDQDPRQAPLQVFVGRERRADQAPVLGTYQFQDGVLRFSARFPFRAGQDYLAVWKLGDGDADQNRGSQVFSIPAPDHQPARVVTVYPTTDVLPENQLKFYIEFSAAMSQHESYRHIHLIADDGVEVELPFLELPQELWDSTGTRFTLLFDPGRIKRGLKPREEVGPSLEEGRRYTLRIDAAWRDATGQPLQQKLEKSFRVEAPDDTQPDPKQWRIQAPSASTAQDLVIQFPEPLDYAMLQHAITVLDSQGKLVPGRVSVDRHETRWSFEPESAWSAGTYELSIDSLLEDRSGNSIRKTFEIDVFRQVDKTPDRQHVTRTFEVR